MGIKIDDISLSIVIPNRGDHESLVLCLESLFQFITSFKNAQVIVVDNNDVPIKAKVAQFRGLDLVECKKIGRSFARNTGALNARGEYILFLDSDCILTHTNFLALLREVESWGDVIDVFQAQIDYDLVNFGLSPLPHSQDIMRKEKPSNMIPQLDTSCLLIKKSVLMGHGMFDTRFERFEDRVLGYKLLHNDFLVQQCLDVFVLKRLQNQSFLKTLERSWEECKWQTLAENKVLWPGGIFQRIKSFKFHPLKTSFFIFWFSVRRFFFSSYIYEGERNQMVFPFNGKSFILNSHHHPFIDSFGRLAFLDTHNNTIMTLNIDDSRLLLQRDERQGKIITLLVMKNILKVL